MVRERSLFDALSADWHQQAAHRSAVVHLRRWQHLAGCFSGYTTVGEVVASFEDRTEKARSARLLNGLLIAAADDPLARRALLQALTAGLRRTTRNLYRRMCDVGNVVSLPWSSRTELEADGEIVKTCGWVGGRRAFRISG